MIATTVVGGRGGSGGEDRRLYHTTKTFKPVCILLLFCIYSHNAGTRHSYWCESTYQLVFTRFVVMDQDS